MHVKFIVIDGKAWAAVGSVHNSHPPVAVSGLLMIHNLALHKIFDFPVTGYFLLFVSDDDDRLEGNKSVYWLRRRQ